MALPDPCMWPVHGMTVSGMHSCLHTISYRGKIHIETLADRRCGDSTCGCLCETQVAGLTRKAQVLPHQGLVCLRSDAGRGNTANTGTARRTHLLTSALGRDDFDGRGEVACTNLVHALAPTPEKSDADPQACGACGPVQNEPAGHVEHTRLLVLVGAVV